MSELKELAKLFLKLGTLGFGGPAAHLAMMHKEIVVKRKWIDEQKFMDMTGAVNLIPGPNSTELAIHIGQLRAGWKGLIVAGLCFVLPAVFFTLIFAVFYRKYGQVPEIQPFLYGIKPTVIAIIVAAVLPLAKRSLKSLELWLIGLTVIILGFLGISEIYTLFGAGFFAMGLSVIRNRKNNTLNNFLPLPLVKIFGAGVFSSAGSGLFFTFLKIGAILYGSGYVLFAFLDTELVATGIISRQLLIDAIAVGQFTPGPLFSSATFIGYQVNYFSGAMLATLGIFLPSFLFVALLNPLIRLLRNSKAASAFLDAVNVASVAIIAVICFKIGKDAITDWRTIVIAVAGFAMVFYGKKINTAFIVLGGAGLGFILSLV